jgi:predicted nucleic acid-binding protein
MVIILDASIAIKWLVAEVDSEQAIKVLNDILVKPDNFAVPELFYFELWNVLSHINKNNSDAVSDSMKIISELAINRFVYTQDLFKTSAKFIEQGLTAYDASYAGLAKMLKGKWLTADSKAHNKIKKDGVSMLLSDY